MFNLLGAICWLEIIARITGPKDHGPYLLGLTAADPLTDFERALYDMLATEE